MTLMDMVMSMVSNTTLLKSMWDEALKMAMHILNRVPPKAVPKTPFELWTGRKPIINHFQVWGCQSEVKVFNPQEKKLDPRIVSGYFIGYPEKSKEYRFYCPSHNTRNVESNNAKNSWRTTKAMGVMKQEKITYNEIMDAILPGRNGIIIPLNIGIQEVQP